MKTMTKTKKRGLASLVTFALVMTAFFVLRSFVVSGGMNLYVRDILNMACINIIAAVSLNMVTGLLGQLVLGHAGFMLVGAYASAMFTKAMGWPLTASLPISLIVGGLLAALVGFIIGIPALRLRGDYLAIITLGFGEIIRVVANNLSITNGAKGFYGFPTFGRNQPSGMFDFVFLIAAFVIAFSYTFGTSRHGRAVIAIREDEIAAEASGVRTTYYKLLTFTLSAFFAGIAGGLYAHQIGIIDPAKFDFNRSVEILMMVVLGGMGSITGSVLAALVLSILPEFLRSLGPMLANGLVAIAPGAPAGLVDALNKLADIRMLIYSLLLIVVMLFRPTGLLGRREIRILPPFEAIVKRFKKPTEGGEAK